MGRAAFPAGIRNPPEVIFSEQIPAAAVHKAFVQ